MFILLFLAAVAIYFVPAILTGIFLNSRRCARVTLSSMAVCYTAAAALLYISCLSAGMSVKEIAFMSLAALTIAVASCVPWMPNWLPSSASAALKKIWKAVFWAVVALSLGVLCAFHLSRTSTASAWMGGFLLLVTMVICTIVAKSGTNDRYVEKRLRRDMSQAP